MKGLFFSLILALATLPAHASAISGTGIFDVQYYDPDHPDHVLYTGAGHFTLAHNVLAAFAFEMLGETWTLADTLPCECYESNGEPSFVLQFQNDAGGGYLSWRFDDETFGFALSVTGLSIGGNSEGSQNPASGEFISQDLRIVPEPATLGILALGLLLSIRRRV